MKTTVGTPVTIIKEPTEVQLPIANIRSRVLFDAENRATLVKGSAVTVEEIARLAIDEMDSSASASLRAANTLRLARMLPPVTVIRGEGGEKSLKKATVPAFDRACELVRDAYKTSSAFQNVRGLIECLDIVEASKLTCSPFAVKESLGYLRTVGALGEDSKLKLTDKVAKALKSGTGVNKVREVITEAKAKRPDLFKPKAKGSVIPPVIIGGACPSAESVKHESDSADKIARELTGIRGRWDKLVGDSKTPTADRDALRKACERELLALCKLAGLDVVLTPAQAGK